MKSLGRLATSAVTLALVAAGTSCSQQSPQEPRNQAQAPKAQQPAPQQHQAQDQAPQPAPQPPHAEQAPSQARQPAPQQQQARQPEPQHQAQPARSAQNTAQPGQPPSNEASNQTGRRNAAENPSPGAIRQIQQVLEQKGFKIGRVDGKLGPRTKRALTRFQRKQGLRQTGAPDQQTLTALGIGGGASTTGQGPNPSQPPSTPSPQQQPAGRK